MNPMMIRARKLALGEELKRLADMHEHRKTELLKQLRQEDETYAQERAYIEGQKVDCDFWAHALAANREPETEEPSDERLEG